MIPVVVKVQKRKDEIEKVKKEQESLINLFSEDRDRREKEEDVLRNKLEVLDIRWKPPFSIYSLEFRKLKLVKTLWLQEASNKIKALSDEKSQGRR